MGRGGELLVENKIGRNDPANSHLGCKLTYMGIIVAFRAAISKPDSTTWLISSLGAMELDEK